MKRFSEKAEKTIYAACAIATFFLAWAFITTFTAAGETTPGPIEVLKLLFTSFFEPIGRFTIYGHLYYSIKRVLIGYTVATVLGIIVGISMGTSRYAEAIIKPIFEMIRPIPPIAWIPLVVVWMGVGLKAKALIIFFTAFVPCVINSYTGIKLTSQVLIDVSRTFGAPNWLIFWKIGIPSSLPMVFAGIRVALGNSWSTLVAAEMLAASAGLGYMIQIGRTVARPDIVIVGMVVIGAIGAILSAILSRCESYFLRWKVNR